MAVRNENAPAGSRGQGAEEALMDVNALGEYLGVAPHTLRIWRMQGQGPEGFKIGGRLVRWRKSDVDAWIDAQRQAAA